jgi:mannose-6-phosphate isomerase-like protein (cupin superfamily)
MLICGEWERADVNIFRVERFDAPTNSGTPCSYYRNTGFDNHYHDYDEFWILYEGSGVVYTENRAFEVDAGDCVVTGSGWHHDFPIVHSPVCAVAVEPMDSNVKRLGHLWEQKDGKAVPDMKRV